MTELLCPAGNYEKLEAALRYGADAVYIAGKMFGMRGAADNFSVDEIYDAVKLARSRNAKIYVTVNTMPRDDEYPMLEEYLDSLRGSGVSAVIAADLGVISLVRERLPGVEIHVSTQASTVSARAAAEYLKMGCRRVVLARELTLDEIRTLRKNAPQELEIEAFVHGSMCISYSGRCLMSNYFTGRDGNRGMCTQPCRWNYRTLEIEEEKRPGESIPLMQTENGTFIMSSRDMCMIEHIPELIEAGIDSMKIEGRMKSAYYTAVTANAYRMALDSYYRDPSAYRFDPAWKSELESVSHREYCTGFYFGTPMSDAKTVTQPGYVRDKAYLSTVLSYDPESGRAVFIQRNKLSEGDTVELITPKKPGRGFVIKELKNADGESIASTPHPSMIFSASVPFPVKEGDILRSC